MHNLIRAGLSFVLIAAIGTSIATTDTARGGQVLNLLVPSYFYPGTGGAGGAGDGWAQMANAASEVPLTAVLNPNSGPLPGPADPNYVTAMTNLENAGGKVVAYVYTNSGNAPLASVESQIATYRSQYGSLINGFFLDGMFVLPSTLAYYQQLDSDIKALNSSYTIIGNPGQPFLNGVSPSDYLSTADVVNIFEGPDVAPGPSDPGYNLYPYGLNWFESDPSSRFSNIVFDVPAVAGDPTQSTAMLADLNKAVQLNAGNVYFTDLTGANPYAALPSYWDQEVAAIHSQNETPEPASLTLAGLGCLAVIVYGQSRRRLAV